MMTSKIFTRFYKHSLMISSDLEKQRIHFFMLDMRFCWWFNVFNDKALSSNTHKTDNQVGLENTRSFTMNAKIKSLMSKNVALALVMGALAQPVLAQEMMAPRSLAEAAADAFNTSECDPKFIEKVAKAQPMDYEGDKFVLIFTSSMMQNGIESELAEPLMIGPLTKAATAAEAAALKGRPICNEPF